MPDLNGTIEFLVASEERVKQEQRSLISPSAPGCGRRMVRWLQVHGSHPHISHLNVCGLKHSRSPLGSFGKPRGALRLTAELCQPETPSLAGQAGKGRRKRESCRSND